MTVTPVLDGQTAHAIRQAVSAAGMGNITDACSIAERALADGGDAIALNALLGMLKGRAGDFEAGIEHLRIAHEARPSDVRIATNLVDLLINASREGEAFALLSDDLVRADSSMHLERLRGFLAQTLEDYPAAVRSYERLVAAAPSDWEAWNNLGNARRSVGEFEGSIEALQKAAKLEPNSPPIQLNLAMAFGAAGDFAEAEKRLREISSAYPADTAALRELHALLREMAKDEEALAAIEEAVRRNPNDIDLILGLGSHQSQMQHYDAAGTAYRRAMEIDPSNGTAHLGLTIVLELTNRTDELFDLIRSAEQRQVNADALQFMRAFGFRREKRYEEGLKALEQVPDSLDSARRAHLHGQLLQGAGRYEEAFAAFERMNERSADDVSQPKQRGARYRALIGRNIEMMTPGLVESWRSESKAYTCLTPAFLVGFPRSGTTLLDTMLMGHPMIEVLEEEPTMREAAQLLPHPADLPTLDDAKIQAARDTYWQVAKSLTPLRPGSLLVDKNPLAMNSLPAIRRLFAEAKIVLALRHPCDVVLSCFITNFRANDGMASFLELDTAAELYDLSFRYFERAQQLFQLAQHTVVYERVVADRERELKNLFQFLGLDWHDQVLDHETTAKGRGRIKTASYSQVIEPIYTRAAGRWWNYRRQLEPILPVLAPWVEKFGYSLDDPDQFPASRGLQ
jgi:tetratricopeptide (TPR) repeat protein